MLITPTQHKVPITLIEEVDKGQLSTFRESINMPTGNFFYDPWEIKPEYKGTVWEELLNPLTNIGEARIIILNSETCYTKHADIDDRYHLNLNGDEGYLINLETLDMHHLVQDGIWYDMNAGILHTATSFGEEVRIQLVVRKLLLRNDLKDPVTISILPGGKNPRYTFDNVLSPWLNYANKQGKINNFRGDNLNVIFDIDKEYLGELANIMPKEFPYTTSNNEH
jgi:hypothetical protein